MARQAQQARLAASPASRADPLNIQVVTTHVTVAAARTGVHRHGSHGPVRCTPLLSTQVTYGHPVTRSPVAGKPR